MVALKSTVYLNQKEKQEMVDSELSFSEAFSNRILTQVAKYSKLRSQTL